jgi:hypothetical protein
MLYCRIRLYNHIEIKNSYITLPRPRRDGTSNYYSLGSSMSCRTIAVQAAIEGLGIVLQRSTAPPPMGVHAMDMTPIETGSSLDDYVESGNSKSSLIVEANMVQREEEGVSQGKGRKQAAPWLGGLF